MEVTAVQILLSFTVQYLLLLHTSFLTYRKLVQFSSVAQACLTLCDPKNCSMPGLPVYHHLPEFTQTHVHWVGDAIQLSHPLSSPSPLALNLSQHQGLYKWVSSPSPGVHPNSCPLSWWCHPTISSSVIPLSSCPQSFPASGSFQMSQLFASGGQSTGVSI